MPEGSTLKKITLQRYIGLAGPAGVGKSTVARELANRLVDASVVPMAQPIKRMLDAAHLVPSRFIYGSQEIKESPLDELYGKSCRYALQTLGTEWGRNLIHENIWVDAWVRCAKAALSTHIIADDVRFPNEAARIRAEGGIVVELRGRGKKYRTDHDSESGRVDADFVVSNLGGLGDTVDSVLQIIYKIW